MSTRTTANNRRIVIVGGGISGLSIAVRLSQSGMPVTLLEASDLGCAASTRNQGWLYSGAWFAPRQRNLARFCHESLKQTLHFCPECVEPGTGRMIYIISSAKTNVGEWLEAWAAAGIPYERVSPVTTAEETGIPEATVKRAFRLPDRAFRPEILLGRLIAQAEYQCVDLRTRTAVAKLLIGDDRVHGVLTAKRETIEAGLVILAANVGGAPLWPVASTNVPRSGRSQAIKAAPQTEFTRVGLKTHCLTVQPMLAQAPYCVVDMEGLNHIPHATQSTFGISRWIPVTDAKDQRPLPAEIDRLRKLVTNLYPAVALEAYDVAGWAGTTVQAMHVDQVEPGLAPMPTVIDHRLEPPFVSNLFSVFPGRASLWPQLAEATRFAVSEKLEEKISDLGKAPWDVSNSEPLYLKPTPAAHSSV
jgi:glycine/D-amino acid oxidase-like deaminating enzyme